MNGCIDINGVLEVYRSLSGESELDGRAAVLCRSAADTLTRQMKSDCECMQEMPRLCDAAGCLAYYRGVLAESAGGVDSFKAGDLTVRCGEETVEAARKLYVEAFASISDLLFNRNFAFRRAQG